ncbi:MAG: SRPBCC family protein [archaeon]|jgi:activator of HSP90 ATPase
MNIKTKNLKQIILINSTPKEVFDAFMDQKKHSKFTGTKATIENKVGGKFSVWDDYATGETLELVPDKKIVQSWRASDWPEEYLSKIILELSFSGKSTKLRFTHKGIPEESYSEIKQGWIDYYWNPMKKMLEGK